jgi:GT2 family glycosyltransferase
VHLFHEIIHERQLLSEDYAFCHRARECGLPIFCDPSVIVDHYEGRMAWRF